MMIAGGLPGASPQLPAATPTTRSAVVALATVATSLLPPASPQLSSPVVSDDAFLAERSEEGKNRRERPASEMEDFVFAKDHSGWKEKSECEVDVDLLWTRELGASVYSTPVLQDLFSDGQPDVVSATFVRTLRALDKVSRAATTHDSTLYGQSRASPGTFAAHHTAAISSAIVLANILPVLNAAAHMSFLLSIGLVP